ERRSLERKGAAEHEVAGGTDHDGPDDPGPELRDARGVAPHCFGLVVFSVLTGSLPGGLPIDEVFATYGSFPAAHSCFWPGLAVIGYGLMCRGPLSPLLPDALLLGTDFR